MPDRPAGTEGSRDIAPSANTVDCGRANRLDAGANAGYKLPYNVRATALPRTYGAVRSPLRPDPVELERAWCSPAYPPGTTGTNSEAVGIHGATGETAGGGSEANPISDITPAALAATRRGADPGGLLPRCHLAVSPPSWPHVLRHLRLVLRPHTCLNRSQTPSKVQEVRQPCSSSAWTSASSVWASPGLLTDRFDWSIFRWKSFS